MHDDWKRKTLVLVLAAGTAALTSGPMLPAGTASAGIAPAIVLNEIHADPDASAGDANGDGTVQSVADEFVEIANTGPAALDVSGWTIADAISTRHVFPPGSVLLAGCGVVVFGGGSPTGSFGSMVVQTASSGSLGLNNGGDTVVIHDGGDVVASYAYGSEGGGNQSLTRDPDIVGPEPLVRHLLATSADGTRFSPGTRVDGSALAGCSGPVPTGTPAATATVAPSSTPTTLVATATASPSTTPTAIVTATPIRTATVLPTATPTATPLPVVTATVTATGTATPTAQVTPTGTATATSVATATFVPTPARTATAVVTSTSTPAATATALPTPGLTATATVTPAVSPEATPTSTVSPTPEPTADTSLCMAAPRVGCRGSVRTGRSVLIVQDHPVDRRDRIVWKWRKGAATSIADFGDPLASDDYALCLYDESASVPRLVLAADLPANDACPGSGDDCWARARAGARVLRYKSTSGIPDGVTRVVLKPGDDGAARITLQARGEDVDVPSLPLALPLRVQLQGVHGSCWESRHTAAGARRNDVRIFRGHSE